MHILLLLLTLFLVSPLYAGYSPNLYQNDPIITPKLEHIQYFQSSTISQSYGYGMWFSASDGRQVKIAIARSSNGIDWYATEVLNVSNNLHSHDPSILYEDGIYALYFGASNGGNISIWKNTAETENNFDPAQAQQILSATGGWEGNSLSSPNVFKVDNNYYLLYAGNGNGSWHVGLATSLDGENWTRCTNNPIISEGSGPAYIYYAGSSFIFFNSPRGLQFIESSDFKGCQTQWGSAQDISLGMGNPNPIVIDNNIWVYGDLNNGIGLMSQDKISVQYPVVIVPGMFASWNKEAILHNQKVSQNDWTINPVVTEYSAIISSLKQLGYSQNTNLFIYPYDWRQPIHSTSDQLDSFIQEHIWSENKYTPIQIIGHSLGGVIAHVYGSDHIDSRPVKKVVSVAAPLKGTLQSYKPLTAGEIERDNSLVWLAENSILNLNTGLFESKKDTIQRFLPVLFDLVPTYPFLVRRDGSYISSQLLNTTLPNYPILSSRSTMSRVAGTIYETNTIYVLSERTSTDTLLNIYPDGHPVEVLYQDGDGLVPQISANISTFYSTKANHGETIYRQDYIHKILTHLGNDLSQVSIPEGNQTPVFPAILLFLQSPATMTVTDPSGNSVESDSYVHLTNTVNGTYSVIISGTGEGSYTFHSWQIGRDNDTWTTFSGQATVNKKDEYLLDFDTITGGLAYLRPTPTAIPTPTSTPLCAKHPHLTAFPHWCKSPVFSKLCEMVKSQTIILMRKQTECRNK